MSIRPRPEWNKKLGQKYGSCYWCDKKWHRTVLNFDAGSVAPTDDETLTGATSGATGVVEESTLLSGTYAGGDATGWVELSNVTGADSEQGTVFDDDESINGSSGGSGMLTANGDGIYQTNGLLYPKKDLIFYRGRWVCRWHFDWYYQRKFWDEENRMNLAELEKDRGTE